MISLIFCLEMNISITTNCTNGKITRTNAIPTAKLKSNVSKYSNNGSAETSTINCRITPSEMLRMLSEYNLTTRCIKAVIVVAVISKY